MTNPMRHRGYAGTAEFSEEDGLFFGRITDIDDIITYEGRDAPELRAAFEAAVDFYLDAHEPHATAALTSDCTALK